MFIPLTIDVKHTLGEGQLENSRFPRNIDITRNIRAKLGGSPEYWGGIPEYWRNI